MPSGPTHEDDKSASVLAFATTIAAASSVLVLLRLYTRIFVIRAFGRDDFSLIVAWILVLGLSSTVALNTRYGLGKHKDALDPDALVHFAKTTLATNLLYMAAVPVVKITFLLQYLRAFPVAYVQLISKVSIVLITLWGAGNILVLLLECFPLSKVWDPTLRPASCIDFLAFWLTYAGIHILTDFIIFGLPLPSLWNLMCIPQGQRIALIGVFGLGFFTCIISIIRLIFIVIDLGSPDPPWDWTGMMSWAVAEVNCALLCACIPTLRPLFNRRHPSRHHSTRLASG